MKNIFRLPVDNQHFKETIEDGKSIGEIAKFLHRDVASRLNGIFVNGKIKYWGSIPGLSNNRNFKLLKEGDELLCYRSGKYIALCEIAFTSINSELSKYSWGETETGKTWELIYFFKDILYFQYVSDVLTTGQTIMAEQSVIMQAIPLEETISGNLYLTLMMYVVNSVGNFASKILDITRDNIEADDQSVFPTHNRSLAVNMNSLFLDYITQEGDRIVIEIGLSGDPIGSGTHTGKIYLGDDNASDLPIDDTSFSGNPWVEIPDNLTFISSINTSVKIMNKILKFRVTGKVIFL